VRWLEREEKETDRSNRKTKGVGERLEEWPREGRGREVGGASSSQERKKNSSELHKRELKKTDWA